MSASIEVPMALDAFLSLNLGNIHAQILSVLEYILPLEYGHSQQAPQGMVGAFHQEHQAWFVEELLHAIQLYPIEQFKTALEHGVTMAALRIMRAIADRTPVDTGRAKGSWDAILPDGTVMPMGPKITVEEQRAILARRSTSQADQARKHAAAKVAGEKARMAEEREAGVKRKRTRKPKPKEA